MPTLPDTKLDDWLNTPQGKYVMDWASVRCKQAIADTFGFNALQIGLPNHDLLIGNRIPLHLCVGETGSVNLCASLTQLPVDGQSIDLIILPFALEFTESPHELLREIERVLRPEGQLVIIGFNPWSLWGAWRWVKRLLAALFRTPLPVPWQGRYFSIPQLRDWLKLLGFEVERGAFGCYAPPCRSSKTLKRLHFLELAGDRWWCFAGGTYLLRAIKRVPGMRLIKPWSTLKRPATALNPSIPRVLRKEQHDD